LELKSPNIKPFSISEAYEQMLDVALATNLLEAPCTEYEVLTRIWALELMKKVFAAKKRINR